MPYENKDDDTMDQTDDAGKMNSIFMNILFYDKLICTHYIRNKIYIYTMVSTSFSEFGAS